MRAPRSARDDRASPSDRRPPRRRGSTTFSRPLIRAARSGAARRQPCQGAGLSDEPRSPSVAGGLRRARCGWFRGAMEFVPRALGSEESGSWPNPRNPPCAIASRFRQKRNHSAVRPAVIAERAREHFDLDHDAPFLLGTCHSAAAGLPRSPRDGSARLIPSRAQSALSRSAAIFERRPGVDPVRHLVHLRGEPIVCTPVDALLCFVRSDLDCLVLEDVVLDRRDVPPAWIESFRDTAPTQTGVSSSVYTLL